MWLAMASLCFCVYYVVLVAHCTCMVATEVNFVLPVMVICIFSMLSTVKLHVLLLSLGCAGEHR